MLRLALAGPPSCMATWSSAARRVSELQCVAVCSDSDVPTSGFGPLNDIEIRATSINELLISHAIDFDAVITRRDSVSTKDLMAAAQSGKHILLEAIGGEDPDAFAELCDVARQAGGVAVVSQAKRHLPSMQTIKRSLAVGDLGRLGLVRVHAWKQRNEPADIDALGLDLDLVCWLFDSEPDVVSAIRSQADNSDGNLVVHLGFSSGGMALIDCQQLVSGTDFFSLSIIGSSGSAIADDHRNQQLIFGPQEPAAVRTTPAPLHGLHMLQELVDAVRNGVAPDACLQTLRSNQRVAEAIRRSLAIRDSVRLEDAHNG